MTTVRELERLLFAAFPPEDATPDDRIGLMVGDDETGVKGIALALDARVIAIEEAASRGCNVLVTHHPVFWHPPAEFLRNSFAEGSSILRAAELGVSLIAMHTNLDCAPVAREMLLEPAGFIYAAPLASPNGLGGNDMRLPGKDNGGKRRSPKTAPLVAALGQIGEPEDGRAATLRKLAARYREAFGAVAKVWGNPERPIGTLAACSGGGGSLVQRVIDVDADCYVTGEVAYHEALELASADIALIELGHDRSELPYRFFLRDALRSAGFDESLLHILGPVTSWWH